LTARGWELSDISSGIFARVLREWWVGERNESERGSRETTDDSESEKLAPLTCRKILTLDYNQYHPLATPLRNSYIQFVPRSHASCRLPSTSRLSTISGSRSRSGTCALLQELRFSDITNPATLTPISSSVQVDPFSSGFLDVRLRVRRSFRTVRTHALGFWDISTRRWFA
jgi:hypothetical protein